jgi:hypothetical protein
VSSLHGSQTQLDAASLRRAHDPDHFGAASHFDLISLDMLLDLPDELRPAFSVRLVEKLEEALP